MACETCISTEKKERVLYLDYLRIVSIAAVMLLHASSGGWYTAELSSGAWKLYNAVDGAVRWCVPVFLMISGALFLDPSRHVSIRRLLSHNVLRIVTAFVFWACVYALNDFRNGMSARDAVFSVFSGHFHMWFLFLIVALYLLVPPLRSIAENEKALEYLLTLSFFVTFLFPWLLNILMLVQIPHTLGVVAAVRSATTKFLSYFPSQYVFYFLLGYYLSQREMKTRSLHVWYALGLAGCLATVVLTRMQSLLASRADATFMAFDTINVLLMAVAVFLFGRFELSRISIGGSIRKRVLHLSKCSFGMYLVHILILEVLDDDFCLDALALHPAVSVCLHFVIMFLASYAVSAVLLRIPVLKKYVV